jgi:hypothetical protein
MHLLLGFLIALAVGLTGIGGGSFTVPALLLIFGLPAGEAVGTAFVFAGVLRLIAAPFYLLGRHVHSRYFRLLLIGAVPGLALVQERQQPRRHHHPGTIAGRYLQHHFCAKGAKPGIRSKKHSMDSVAGISHRD